MMTKQPIRSLAIDDPILSAAIERKLEPYKNILSPAMLEEFRRDARLKLSAHPYTIALVNQIRPVTSKSASHKRLVDPGPLVEGAPLDEEAARSSGKGNR